MADENKDINEIIENYEKQFQNTETASFVVRSTSNMTKKLDAITNELINLALHSEKEEIRFKACLAIQNRIMGPANQPANSEADDMFKKLEAASKRRQKGADSSPPDNTTEQP